MQHTARIEANTAFLSLMADYETFDGACDPAFDTDLEELERQIAEYRLIHASDMN